MTKSNNYTRHFTGRAGSSLKYLALLLGSVMLFFSNSIHSQVLNNIGAVISIDNAVVDGGDIENTSGDIVNEGTINLLGSFNNLWNSRGSGYYNIQGNWNNTGFFAWDTSTVQLNGSALQNVINTSGDNFYNLRFNNSGTAPGSSIRLFDNIDVLNKLIFDQGIVDYNDRINKKLYLQNKASSSLIYTSGHIIGKFERGINSTNNYLFPLGSSDYYNPLNLKPNAVNPGGGSILSEFFYPDDPGDVGLPLIDSSAIDTSEIWDAFPEGYWSLNANNGFATSNYNIVLDGAGFSGIQAITRILKRDATVGVWELDGTHQDVVGTVAERDNLVDGISNNGNHFGFGRARPRIKTQPENDTVCELGTDANFKVKATGRGKLRYQWQVNDGGGWVNISTSDANYTGADEKELFIITAFYSMNNYQYRVIITDKYDNFNITVPVTLTVEPLPTTIATPADDLLCNDDTTSINVTSDLLLPGTTFILEVLNSGTTSITGAYDDAFGGDTVIRHVLNNPGSNVDSVIYRIIPYGPYKRYCEGYADTVTIWVNPTPDIDLNVPDTVICNEAATQFNISTLNTVIRGDWYYDLTVTADPTISGDRASGRLNENTFVETLVNDTTVVQKVIYHFHPLIEPDDNDYDCENGVPNDTTIIIWVNPTPDIEISIPDTVICHEDTTTITITTPNTDLRGNWYYDLTIDAEIGVTGTLTEGRIIEEPFVLTLSNNTPHVKKVTYNFHPVIEPDDNGDDCENGVPNDTSITIFVNPLPVLLITVPQNQLTGEQIYCNGDSVEFSMVNYQQTVGTMKYDLDVSLDTAFFYGDKLTENGRTIENFTDTLVHYQSTIKELNYHFQPYIENLAGNATCYRSDNDQNVNIKMVPVLHSLIAPKDTVYGGFNITCNGDSDGTINLETVGGDYRSTYSIVWKKDNVGGEILKESDVVSTDILDNLTAGFYYYSITDQMACFHDTIKEITQPDPIIVAKDSVADPECLGTSYIGDIYLQEITGGAYMYDYKYLWRSTGTGLPITTTRDLIGAGDDGYEVTITDINKCTGKLRRTIEIASPIDAFPIYKTDYGSTDTVEFNISCNGLSDGRVQVSSSATVNPIKYTWYDENLNLLNREDTITDRPAGIYYFTVEDGRGCMAGSSITDTLQMVELKEPDVITFVRDTNDIYDGDWDIKCFGDSTGKISLTYLGGHTPYQDNNFVWTTLSGRTDINTTDSIQGNLTAGEYAVQVTDAFGCVGDTSFVLEQPDRIKYDATLRENAVGTYNITCFGDSDGDIQLINLQGGGPKSDPGNGPDDYTYKWTAPGGFIFVNDTLQNQSNLIAGDYRVRVQDKIGCFIDTTISVIQPDTLLAVPDTSNMNGFQISCYNWSDGMISLTASGGTRPYTYDWSNGVGGNSDTVVTGLDSGYYAVTVIDPNGCKSSLYEWTLDDPDTIRVNPSNSDLIECFGDTSTIHIYPSGGVEGYSYEWQGFADDDHMLNGVPFGMYYVTVEDANGCIVEDSVLLNQRSKINPVIKIQSDYYGQAISCFGMSDAEIELFVSGGNSESYNFEWSTGPQDDDKNYLKDLPAGEYSVQGTDASGCVFATSIEVIEPQKLLLNYTTTDPECFGFANGEIRIAPIGGTPFKGSPSYYYYFEGKDSLAIPEFTNLAEGTYEARVTDANQCDTVAFIELIAPVSLSMDYETTPAECPDETNGTLSITFIDGGTPPYTVNGDISTEFPSMSPGDFEVTIMDAHKCIYIDTIDVGMIHSSCLSIPSAFTPNGDGANDVWRLDEDEDGSDMYLYPDAELTIINRWGEVIHFSDDVANEPWDGTYKGRDLPVDSYYYMLDLKNGDPVITGTVTIVR